MLKVQFYKESDIQPSKTIKADELHLFMGKDGVVMLRVRAADAVGDPISQYELLPGTRSLNVKTKGGEVFNEVTVTPA